MTTPCDEMMAGQAARRSKGALHGRHQHRIPDFSAHHAARFHGSLAGAEPRTRREDASDGKRIEPIRATRCSPITPTTTFADCPQLDVICVPGGLGTDALLNDEETLDFLRKQAKAARYITSVCTGSMVLAAAGLLDGYRATTHWSASAYLGQLGAIPEKTARLHRSQPHHWRRRHRRHRLRPDARRKAVGPHHRGDDPAHARIQSRAAVQSGLAGNRAAEVLEKLAAAVRESRAGGANDRAAAVARAAERIKAAV